MSFSSRRDLKKNYYLFEIFLIFLCLLSQIPINYMLGFVVLCSKIFIVLVFFFLKGCLYLIFQSFYLIHNFVWYFLISKILLFYYCLLKKSVRRKVA